MPLEELLLLEPLEELAPDDAPLLLEAPEEPAPDDAPLEDPPPELAPEDPLAAPELAPEEPPSAESLDASLPPFPLPVVLPQPTPAATTMQRPAQALDAFILELPRRSEGVPSPGNQAQHLSLFRPRMERESPPLSA